MCNDVTGNEGGPLQLPIQVFFGLPLALLCMLLHDQVGKHRGIGLRGSPVLGAPDGGNNDG